MSSVAAQYEQDSIVHALSGFSRSRMPDIPQIRQQDAPSDVEDYRLCQGHQLVRLLSVGRTRPATKLSKHGIRYRGIDISDK